MQGSTLSLADIQDETEPRQVDFDLSRVDVGKLTMYELLDLCDAAGIEPDAMTESLESGGMVRARLLYGIAWVILRRKEPGLTFEETITFDLNVTGEPTTDTATQKRADALVAVATISGTSPEVAGQMTLAEVGAYTDIATRRVRAAKRRR